MNCGLCIGADVYVFVYWSFEVKGHCGGFDCFVDDCCVHECFVFCVGRIRDNDS